ncbi:MAG: NADH dehydrogenase [Hungatella sp.]|nr:NADH dehydrogenase [Hungatella sp.]
MSGWEIMVPGICGMGLHLKMDGFRMVYTAIAVLMWGVAGAFSREYMAHYKNKSRYYVFFWATFLATVGVFLSADLYTTFIFFEIMSFTSYVWVAFDEKAESLQAAETYLAVAVIGGMVMLMGLFLLYGVLGTLDMDKVGPAAKAVLAGRETFENGRAIQAAGGFASPKVQLYVAGGLMLFGFGAKAGCFPLHIWLPKAHPVAPAPASALLSGILTKAGVFGIIIVSCVMFGNDGAWGLLIAGLGLITMFLGALLAVFSVNLKRTLACSSVSQIGFIMTGIGMSCLLSWAGEGNLLAVRGAFLHMVNHSLIKLVLFLCAGAVYMNLHQLDLNDVRGFGRGKPELCFCFLMGALGIGGIPLWNGYVSKTLLHESIVEYAHLLEEGVLAGEEGAGIISTVPAALLPVLTDPAVWKAAEWVFLFTGGMTVAYMVKLFVALFVDKHPVRQAEFDEMSSHYMKPLSRLVLVGAAVILPALGMMPHVTMDRIADLGQGFFGGTGHAHVIAFFSPVNLKGGLISIGIGLVLYAAVIRQFLMRPETGAVGTEAEASGGDKKAGVRGRCYVNRWPSWLDLENLVYRPVLQVFMAVASVVCRALDHMTDGAVVLLRKTVYRQLPEPKAHLEGNWLAHLLGGIVDGFGLLWEKVSGKSGDGQVRVSAVHHFIEREKQMKHMGMLVEQSFSFGLILFCIGLCLTLGYLLFVFIR